MLFTILIGASSLDEVPPVAHASSFTVGIPSRLPHACDGIGRWKNERGRPLLIYKPEERSQPAASKSDADSFLVEPAHMPFNFYKEGLPTVR